MSIRCTLGLHDWGSWHTDDEGDRVAICRRPKCGARKHGRQRRNHTTEQCPATTANYGHRYETISAQRVDNGWWELLQECQYCNDRRVEIERRKDLMGLGEKDQ